MSAPKQTAGFDTSGAVHGVIASDGDLCAVLWRDLSPFTQGYVEALWSAVIELRRDAEDRVQLNLDDLGFRHLAPETLARIIADCEIGQTFAAAVIQREPKTGALFWKTRQDGSWKQHGFPPLTVQLGDDGKVRFAKATGASQ